jgi:hypothetical protein
MPVNAAASAGRGFDGAGRVLLRLLSQQVQVALAHQAGERGNLKIAVELADVVDREQAQLLVAARPGLDAERRRAEPGGRAKPDQRAGRAPRS